VSALRPLKVFGRDRRIASLLSSTATRVSFLVHGDPGSGRKRLRQQNEPAELPAFGSTPIIGQPWNSGSGKSESEFAGALRVSERHGNTLSPLLRQAWDGHTLSTMTRSSSLKSSNPHISIVAHITADELRNCISRTDLANGLANRFLFALVRRSKILPFGGDLTDSEILEIGDRLKQAIDSAKSIGLVRMTETAKKHWVEVYGPLSRDRDGLLGAITARAEAQVIRLALVYALLDGQPELSEHHLAAGLAVWEYCEASAVYIFGGLLGDPIADEIFHALQQAGSDGMTRTAIRDRLGRNQTGARIDAAMQLLATKGRARMIMKETRGRPSETWFAVVR
jgi:hypothetical protein